MKKCPYCAELIQEEAIFCRYCKHDLDIKNEFVTPNEDLDSVTLNDETILQTEIEEKHIDQRDDDNFESFENNDPVNEEKSSKNLSRIERILVFWFVLFGINTLINLFDGSIRPGVDLYWNTITALILSIITFFIITFVVFISNKIKLYRGNKNSPSTTYTEDNQVKTDVLDLVETRIGFIYLRAYKIFCWVLAFFLLVTGINVITGDLALSPAFSFLGIYLIDTFKWISYIIIPYWLYVFIRYKWKTSGLPMKIFVGSLAGIVIIFGLIQLFFYLFL